MSTTSSSTSSDSSSDSSGSLSSGEDYCMAAALAGKGKKVSARTKQILTKPLKKKTKKKAKRRGSKRKTLSEDGSSSSSASSIASDADGRKRSRRGRSGAYSDEDGSDYVEAFENSPEFVHRSLNDSAVSGGDVAIPETAEDRKTRELIASLRRSESALDEAEREEIKLADEIEAHTAMPNAPVSSGSATGGASVSGACDVALGRAAAGSGGISSPGGVGSGPSGTAGAGAGAGGGAVAAHGADDDGDDGGDTEKRRVVINFRLDTMSMKLKVGWDDKIGKALDKCQKKWGGTLKFSFDGDLVQPAATPNTLDMDTEFENQVDVKKVA